MRVAQTLTALAVGAILSAATLATAEAQVTDFDTYPATPQAQLGAGCDFTGVAGVLYSVNGGPSLANLNDLAPFGPDDVVTMTWTDVAPACVGSAVSLAIKDATEPVFDPADNQVLVNYATTTLAAGPGSLSFTLPGLFSFQHACNYQFDAIVGLPLTYVGPGGSFYNASLRGDGLATTLIGARNGTYTECVPITTTVPETTTTTEEATTTTVPEFDETTTTTVPQTTTTQPTTATSVGVAGEVEVREEELGHGPRCHDSQAALTSAEVGYCQAAQPQQRLLAHTGTKGDSTRLAFAMALVLIAGGVVLVLKARR